MRPTENTQREECGMNRLDGKVALISGAARGIGAEAARLMAEAGASVVIADILEEPGRVTAAAITSAGGQAAFARLDVTREESWDAAVETAVKRFGGLDILVNNAGVFIGKDFEEASLDDWHRLVSVNMTGVFLGTRAAVPALRDRARDSRHGSSVVNLASIAGLVGSQVDQLYSMTKGGVTLFTKSTALSFARKGYRIRVNSVHPGVIDTDMGAQTFVSRAAQMNTNDVGQMKDMATRMHPIGRLGTAEDVARGILFLASDDAGFMTGSSLVIDGGWTAQ